MSNRRLLVEIGVVIAVALALWGWGTWERTRTEQDCAKREAAIEARLAESEAHGKSRAERIGRLRGRAYVEGFAAGIRGLVVSKQIEALDTALAELLRSDGILYIHVVDSSGEVLVSSDRKLPGTSPTDPLSRQALTATAYTESPAEREGAVELVQPIGGASGNVAVLRIGYDLAALLEGVS